MQRINIQFTLFGFTVYLIELVLSDSKTHPPILCPDLYCPTFGCTPSESDHGKPCPCLQHTCECNLGFVRKSIIDIGVCLIDNGNPCYEIEPQDPFSYHNSTKHRKDFYLNCLRLAELQYYSKNEEQYFWKSKIEEFEKKDYPFFIAWRTYSIRKPLSDVYCASGKCGQGGHDSKCDSSGNVSQNSTDLPRTRDTTQKCPEIRTKQLNEKCITDDFYNLVKSGYPKDSNEDKIIITDEQVQIYCSTGCCKDNKCIDAKDEYCKDRNKTNAGKQHEISKKLISFILMTILLLTKLISISSME